MANLRRDAAVAGTVLVLAVSSWITPKQNPRPAPSFVEGAWQPPGVLPFKVGEAIEAQPAWSPAGDLFAYASDEAGNDDVWTREVSGAHPLNLTENHKGEDSFPAWSPDAQRIAFYSDRDGGGIYTMTALGSDVRQVVSVAPSVVYAFSLQWASNDSLVYTNFDDYGATQVYRVVSSGSTPYCLTCFKTKVRGARAGQLSPSSRLLAFVGSSSQPGAPLFVLDLLTEEVTTLAGFGDVPRWQGDERLIYVSVREGSADLWEIGVNPRTGGAVGEPTRVTSGLNVTAFSVSSDGRRILALQETTTSNLWVFSTGSDRIDRLSLGTPLTTGAFLDERPRWSSDGRDVCFTSNRPGSGKLWTIASAGETPTQLTSTAGFEDCQYSLVANAEWSPVGSRLVTHLQRADGAARLGIAEVNAASGAVTPWRELDVTGAGDEHPRWSPDGRSVVSETLSGGPLSWNLWVVDADSGRGRQVTDLPGNERSATWQAQPLFVYFVKDQRSLWRIPMSDASTPSGPPSPWLVLPRMRVPAGSVDISRDGKRLVVALAKPESDLWLIERK